MNDHEARRALLARICAGELARDDAEVRAAVAADARLAEEIDELLRVRAPLERAGREERELVQHTSSPASGELAVPEVDVAALVRHLAAARPADDAATQNAADHAPRQPLHRPRRVPPWWLAVAAMLMFVLAWLAWPSEGPDEPPRPPIPLGARLEASATREAAGELVLGWRVTGASGAAYSARLATVGDGRELARSHTLHRPQWNLPTDPIEPLPSRAVLTVDVLDATGRIVASASAEVSLR